MTRFVKDGITLQFNQEPVRDGAMRTVELVQATSKDSAGNHYAYNRRARLRKVWPLTFPGLDDDTLDDLYSFFATAVDGVRHAFTWYDHVDTARTVRLATPSFTVSSVGPGRHRVVIELIEDAA